ncbi:MAG TPA: DUF4214 domain-containing protein [Pyrinomonadaceae bacterium]|nr:DUF4214 domain-containing protein [Pyrinomonadaceae bacterium]
MPRILNHTRDASRRSVTVACSFILSRLRTAPEIGRHLISLLLVLALLVSTTPAAPKTVVDVVGTQGPEWVWWFRTNDVLTRLSRLVMGHGIKVREQEKQSERDERVTRIVVLPRDVTVQEGQQVNFTAVAYDQQNNQVAGVNFKWSARDESRGRVKGINSRGDFKALAAGNYTVTAEGAGQKTTVHVIVGDGIRKRRGDDKPLETKNKSTRDLPPEASQGAQFKRKDRKNSTNLANQTSKTSTGSSQRAFAHTRGARRTKLTAKNSPNPPAAYFLDDGWGNDNYWSADDSGNRRGNPPGAAVDGGAGSANFQFTAPVMSLAGRGIDVSLSLTYNSRVWNKAGNNMNFDLDRDWPAPGFNLGFGKMLGMGVYNGGMLIEADGTRHAYSGTVTIYNWGTTFVGHTTDGTFIDYSYTSGTNGYLLYGQATLANGTRIDYNVQGPQGLYPTRITNANGNYITITYVNNTGPRIQTVTDTLGRTVTFHYDSVNRLTAITAPGLNGGTRTLIRLHYSQLTLNTSFAYPLATITRESAPWVIDAIYYPGSNMGYWLSQSDDSYSTYGMLKKVSERRAMTFSGPDPVPPGSGTTEQGSITAGTITREEVYNYPLNTSDTTGTQASNLGDAPTFTSCTESWTRDGSSTMDQAVTGYEAFPNANPRTVTITLPNGTTSKQYSHNAPGSYLDGLIYLDETRSGSAVLNSSATTWSPGAYNSARPSEIIVTNQNGQFTKTTFTYGSVYNQVTDVRNYDFGGTSLLKSSRTQYQNSSNYTSRHIFNLPLVEEIYASDNTTRVSRVEYQYDGQTMTNTPGVIMHDDAWDPYFEPIWIDENCYLDCSNTPIGEPCDWVCDPGYWWTAYDSATDYRGNLTQKTIYANTAVPSEPISENYRYDITGNRVLISIGNKQTTFNYTASTSYGFPLSQTDGSPTDPLHQITTSSIYDLNTGVVRSATDANERTSQTEYDPLTLRPVTESTLAGAHIDYAYDDNNLNRTQTIYLQSHPTHTTIAEQNITFLNGRGQVRQEKSLGDGSVWDLVDTVYDAMGRISQQSLPYRSGDTIRWNLFTYDALGRSASAEMPDGSKVQSFYNETSRPNVASSLPGETVRVVDAWGRERWSRNDALGSLVEVVEPDPHGNGSVATNGLVTTYTYNTMGDLTGVTQGSQTRSFKYDALGRLKAQRLAETSATLNDAGTYVGAGSWSDVFTYDERSNLTSRIDARGVKTLYNYNSDPLNRLQSISFDTTGFGDTNNPVLAAPSVIYQYRTKSSGGELKDITQVSSITTTNVSTEVYTFDVEGRIQTSTLTLNSRPSYPFAKQYTYDTFDRITDILYPAEYGNGAAPRRTAHQNYDVANRLTSLTVDGQLHASNIVYNAAGNSTSIKVGVSGTNQVTESYSYDALTGLLDNQTVTRNGSTLLNFSYNYAGANGKRTGQVVSITNNLDNNKNRGYEYDALGRLKRVTSGQNVNWAQRYEYDRYGNRPNAYSYAAESYVRNFYQHGLNRQPTSTELQNWLSALQSAYTQGQSQFLATMQSLGSSIFNSQEYINRGRNDPEFVYDLYKTYLYREPDQGGWTHWTGQVAAVGRSNVRVAFEVCPEFSLKVGGTSPFSPPGGASVAADGVQSLLYDAANNRITNSGWYYDAAGNQTRVQSGGVWHRFQYDAANRLVRIKADDNITVLSSFTYGPDNQRLITEEGGTRTYFAPSGGLIAAEYTETGSSVIPVWSKSYVYLGARLLSTLTPTGSGGALVDYHHPDRLGTRIVTNAQNTSYFEQVHLPFGTAIPHESTGATNRRFTSYERSTVPALQYLDYAVNRHYDNQLGRFTQVDPIGFEAVDPLDPQTLNMYAYCANDPVNAIDPDGLFFKKLFKAIWKVLTSKWFIIAATVALTVISLGSSLGYWALQAANTSTMLGTPVTSAVLFGTHTTTLGWIAAGLSTALAIPALGSLKATLTRVAAFAVGQVVGAVGQLAGLGGSIGPGGTPEWNPAVNDFRRVRRNVRRGNGPVLRFEPLSRMRRARYPTFRNLKDHAKRHSELTPFEYYEQARAHMMLHHWKFNFYHDGQSKIAYVTQLGPDWYMFTSVSRNRFNINTHMPVNGQYLRNIGITLPKQTPTRLRLGRYEPY